MQRLRRVLLAIAVAVSMPAPALAADDAKGPDPVLSEEECRALWNMAAGRSDLSRDQAAPYVASFEAVDANHDKKISNGEFKIACSKGFVHKRAP
jgi:hypothetical protein